MRVVIRDEDFLLVEGDAKELAPRLRKHSIDCVVTSPPYYGLRDYDTGYWEGGDTECDHAAARKKTRYDYSLASSPIQDGSRTGTDAVAAMWKDECPSCGASRVDLQLGQEKTVKEYVNNLVTVFRAAADALAPHATLWVNIGDSYDKGELRGVPWKFAFAMQADGWRLCRDVIWAKPNPMTESVKGRPTTSHEYLFMFAKTKWHYYDWWKVRERASFEERLLRSVWNIATVSYEGAHFATFPPELPRKCIEAGCPQWVCVKCGQPRRRIVESTPVDRTELPAGHPERRPARYDAGKAGDAQAPGPGQRFSLALSQGFTACGCGQGYRPGRVLDPFLGSGTTAKVARDLRRSCVGFELNPDYCDQIRKRTSQLSLLNLETS